MLTLLLLTASQGPSADSLDQDQIAHDVQSDLDLNCLLKRYPQSYLEIAIHWVFAIDLTQGTFVDCLDHCID